MCPAGKQILHQKEFTECRSQNANETLGLTLHMISFCLGNVEQKTWTFSCPETDFGQFVLLKFSGLHSHSASGLGAVCVPTVLTNPSQVERAAREEPCPLTLPVNWQLSLFGRRMVASLRFPNLACLVSNTTPGARSLSLCSSSTCRFSPST